MIEYGVFAVGKPDAALVGETNLTASESSIRATITGADTKFAARAAVVRIRLLKARCYRERGQLQGQS